jgi:hypothetical protein
MVEVAVGAEILMTLNVDTNLDITNGTCATVAKIILDPREPPVPLD